MSRILIVDDDRELCALLAEYLRREGLQVDVVHDGESALAQLRDPATRPDLMILDVMMPGQNGLDTLRELRLQHRPRAVRNWLMMMVVDKVRKDDRRARQPGRSSCGWR